MEQYDGRNPNCGITIYLDVGCHLEIALDWLKNRSGISREYTNKILIAVMSTKTSLQLELDDSANCFDMMQQIKQLVVYQCGIYRIEVKNVTCSYGRFVQVKRTCSLEDKITNLNIISEELRQHGDVLNLERSTIHGICTGNVESAMFVWADSKLLDAGWVRTAKIYEVQPFFATESKRVDEDKVKVLWEKYGPRKIESLTDIEKLVDYHAVEEIYHIKSLTNGIENIYLVVFLIMLLMAVVLGQAVGSYYHLLR